MSTTIAPHTNTEFEPEDRGANGHVDRFFDLLASWRVAAISGALFAVFAYLFFATSAPFSIPTVEEECGAAPLDVRPYSSAADVAQFLDQCGETGRQAYRNLQLADLFYPRFPVCSWRRRSRSCSRTCSLATRELDDCRRSPSWAPVSTTWRTSSRGVP